MTGLVEMEGTLFDSLSMSWFLSFKWGGKESGGEGLRLRGVFIG